MMRLARASNAAGSETPALRRDGFLPDRLLPIRPNNSEERWARPLIP